MNSWDTSDDFSDILDDVPDNLRGKKPEIHLTYIGNKTVITNFSQILSNLSRPARHLRKFISSTLGVRTNVKDTTLELSGKYHKNKIDDVLDKYIKTFIVCSNCSKPDTTLKIKKSVIEIRCLACGFTDNIKM